MSNETRGALLALAERASGIASDLPNYQAFLKAINPAVVLDLIRDAERAQPAAPVTTQEPVAWLVVSPDELEPVKGVAHSQEFADKYRSTGWSVIPLYTHADASEVERLRVAVEHYCKLANEVIKERDAALAQLAERDALLRRVQAGLIQWCEKSAAEEIELIEAALSASAEPKQ